MQGFFASLFARESLSQLRPGVTRFRWFLVACLKNWLASAKRHDYALKRGGTAIDPLPLHELESGVAIPVPAGESPEQALDRAWAKDLFERAFARLEADAARRGRGQILEVLRPVLLGAGSEGGYAALGAALQVPEGTARKMVFDFRVRLGEFLREEVLQTVADPDEADQELRYLVSLL